MSDLNKRLGIIHVSDRLIEQEPENLLKVFKDLLVLNVQIEHTTANGYISHYMCLSKRFDVVEEGKEIPVYDVILHSKDGNLDAINFKKRGA